MPPKKETDNVEVTTASFPKSIRERWEALNESTSWKNFNAYVNYVILQDIEERERLSRMGVIVRPPAEGHPKEE